MRAVLFAAGLLVLAQPGSSAAQYPHPYGPPWVWGGGYHHASTYEEGVQRGMADVIRSKGAYNLMTSEAMKNYEDARRKYIENRMYGTETYFKMRELNRAARAAERGPAPTMEDAIRYSRARVPKRLSVSELDPLTGRIEWPVALLTEDYGSSRKQLEILYTQRAATGYFSGPQMLEVDSLTKRMQTTLKSQIKQYPPQVYSTAKSFLDSLAYEATQRPG